MKSARCKALAVGLTAGIAMFGSSLSYAVSLGEITLNSALNEPLDATIRLVQLEGYDERDIDVSMASRSDFERAGMENNRFIRGVEFTVEAIDAENGLIHLSSTEPVTEPYLSFLVDARWPSGRMMREYTVLVDLPAFRESPAEPVTAPDAASPTELSTSEQPEPAPTPEPQAPVPQPAPEPARQERSFAETEPEDAAQGGQAGEYRVRNNDSLWNIARANSADDVSVHQAMLAIQRANPDAFIDGNINGLRSGEVLRIPSLGEMLSMNQDEAVSEVALQNQSYGLSDGSVDNQPLAAGGGAGTAPDEGDELRVLSSEDVEAAAGAAGSGLEEQIASLEMQLMMSEEELDRATLENAELQSSLEELDSQIELLDNIIALEDETLADMQAELALQAEAEASTEAEELAAANDTVDEAAVDGESTDTASTSEASTSTSSSSQPAAEGLLDRMMGLLRNNYVLFGGAAFLLALVLGFLILRRRRDEQLEDEFEVYTEPQDSNFDEALAAGLAAEEVLDETDESDGGESGEDKQDQKDEQALENEQALESELDELIAEADALTDDDQEQQGEIDIPDLEEEGSLDPEGFSTEEGLAGAAAAAGIAGAAAAASDSDKADEVDEESEMLEFTLDDKQQPETTEAAAADADEDVESIEFNADAGAEQPLTPEVSEDAVPEESGAEGDENFDLGNLSLDEDDAEAFSFEDEDELPDDQGLGEDNDSSRINLAVAYEAIGDMEAARNVLNSIIEEGDEADQAEARRLLDEWRDK